MKWGILFRWQSLWIGAHWSPYNKRLCLNLIPFVTLWITARGGEVPKQGFNICRNDLTERVEKAKAEMLERKFSQVKKISLLEELDRIAQATHQRAEPPTKHLNL